MIKCVHKIGLNFQAGRHTTMAFIRKVLKLTRFSFAVTIPPLYAKTLGLKIGDFLELSLETPTKLVLRRREFPKKP